MRTKKFFTFLYLLFAIFYLHAQTVQQEWVRQFSWGNYTRSLSVKLDSSNNIYVLLRHYTDTTFNDFGILKYNNSGTLLWDTTYNGLGNLDDQPAAFAVTKSGNVYIIGNSSINLNGFGTLVKYNTNGVLQWVRTPYGGFSNITLDHEGNIIIIGGTGGDTSFAKIAKYNSNGDSLWNRSFPNLGYSVVTDIYVDDSDNIYILLVIVIIMLLF